MKPIKHQRQDLRRLWYRTHLALDDLYADVPDHWAHLVMQHAERDRNGNLRITPFAKARILAACEADLIDLEMAVTVLLSGAVKRAADLPHEAIAP
jgi:hypothetical protein